MFPEFEETVAGIPCIVRVLDWEPYRKAVLRLDPNDCCAAEGGVGEWEILDLDGRAAPWLEKKLTTEERSRIEQAVYDLMEG
jgi:hypothetical protein